MRNDVDCPPMLNDVSDVGTFGCRNTRYCFKTHFAYRVNPSGIVVNVYGLVQASSRYHPSNTNALFGEEEDGS